MLTETGITGSDDWWLMTLATDLGLDFPRLGKLKKYREGDAPVPEDASPAMRAAYRRFVQMGRLNVCDLIVDAKVNRRKVVGFRTAAAGDDLGDMVAWKNWKRSRMGVGSKELFADQGHYGSAFVITTGQTSPGTEQYAEQLLGPSFIPRNGWTMASRQLATAPWLTEAAVQVGYDPILGADVLNLYRRGYLRTAVRPTTGGMSSVPSDGSVWTPGNGWTWLTAPIPYGFTVENVVTRFDAPDRMGFYEKHLDTIDRINDTIKQRSTIIAMQAFRQRAIKGNLPQEYPVGHERAGEKIDYNEIFKAGPAALWLIPEDADIWESAVTDITPILSATKDDLKHLAAVTATPLYILSPDAASGSAQGASLARESLVFSVEDLNDRDADSFATMHATGFAAMNDVERAEASEIETLWAPVDQSSILERAATSVQAKSGGMPQRMVDEKIFGLTPAEQRQARQDRQDEAFDASLSAAPDPLATPDPEVDPDADPDAELDEAA